MSTFLIGFAAGCAAVIMVSTLINLHKRK